MPVGQIHTLYTYYVAFCLAGVTGISCWSQRPKLNRRAFKNHRVWQQRKSPDSGNRYRGPIWFHEGLSPRGYHHLPIMTRLSGLANTAAPTVSFMLSSARVTPCCTVGLYRSTPNAFLELSRAMLEVQLWLMFFLASVIRSLSPKLTCEFSGRLTKTGSNFSIQ